MRHLRRAFRKGRGQAESIVRRSKLRRKNRPKRVPTFLLYLASYWVSTIFNGDPVHDGAVSVEQTWRGMLLTRSLLIVVEAPMFSQYVWGVLLLSGTLTHGIEVKAAFADASSLLTITLSGRAVQNNGNHII